MFSVPPYPHLKKILKMDTSLRDKTLKLLHNRDISITFRVIQKDTGIKEDWLSKFSQGLIDKPNVNYIETLYNYLNNSPLKV